MSAIYFYNILPPTLKITWHVIFVNMVRINLHNALNAPSLSHAHKSNDNLFECLKYT